MSLHILLLNETVTGGIRHLVFDVSFIGPYPLGGESLPARRINLWRVNIVHVSPQQGYWFSYDRETETFHVYNLDLFQTATDVGVFFTDEGDPVNAPLKIPAGVIGAEDIPVVFTEEGDPVNAPAKIVAGTNIGIRGHEVSPGVDLSILQHILITAEGF